MSVFASYLLGLVVAHVAWLYFFTTGRLLWQNRPDNPQPVRLDTLVVTSVAGMALSGFGLLFLGSVHLLNRFGFAGLLVSEATLFWLLKSDNWLSPTFWRGIVQEFVKAWTFPALCIYIVFLALGLPAILPPTGSDPVSYHLAYAADWANAGDIRVDPFLRFPYYANNFLLFDSAFFVLKLGNYCNFLTWLCGLLTCLGVLAFFASSELRRTNKHQRRRWFFSLHEFLVPLSLAISPVFLAYLNNGFVDVPIGLFVLVPVLCAYKTLSHRLFTRELAITAAFCVGMKLTLIGHLPFFIASLLLASIHRLRAREIALLLSVLVAFSLPWYIRNLWETHDPTPPIFNSYFKHRDPIFNQADADWIYRTGKETDLKRPLRLLLLPFRYFIAPGQAPFGLHGVTAAFLLLYVPMLFLVVLLCYRKTWHAPKGFIYLSGASAYLALSWFYNADGRHAIHWYPVLVAWIGVVISIICLRADRLWGPKLATWTHVVTAAFCFALVVPSPTRSSVELYRKYYAATSDFASFGGDRKRYLEKNVPGYRAAEAVVKTLRSEHKQHTRVLALLLNLNFYFRKNANIISVGDYFGPARYGDLYNEVVRGKDDLSYLTRLDISAVITQPSLPDTAIWWSMYYVRLREYLRDCDYIEYSCDEKNIAIFLKSDIKSHGGLHPVP